jgi:hypothetical protein
VKEREMYVTFQPGNLKREDHLKNKSLDGRVILNSI